MSLDGDDQEAQEGQQWGKADYHNDDDPDDIINMSNTLSGSNNQEAQEGQQWGKAGPGGAYWRPCAVTGQGFLDKMV